MKKIISIILSAIMLLATAAITAGAAEVETGAVSADEYRFEELSITTLSNNTLKSYTNGITAENNPKTSAIFTNDSTRKNYSFYLKDCLNGAQTLRLEKGNYEAMVCNGGNLNRRYNFEKTGGVYVLMKFKLSDFSSYFNEDGTHTESYRDGYTHNFNFTDEGDGNRAQLVILSGGYVNFVAPDKDGYVQAYICKQLGVNTYYMTNFRAANGTMGGGTVGSTISRLAMGNSDTNGFMSVDDVTAIQKYTAAIEEFSNIQLRNADVNLDGKITIDDATMVQKYLAGLL